jgi:xanthine dehydrogenase accessory factor
MRLIWEAAVRQFEKKRNFVLATILSVQGSSPRQVGAKILVLDNGDVVGTIGGGLFEANVRDFATTALASKASSRLNFSFHGGDAESDQMICGGSVDVLIEFIPASAKAKEHIYKNVLNSLQERISAFLMKRIDLEPGQSTEKEIPYICVDEKGKRFGDLEDWDHCLNAIPPRRLLKPTQVIKLDGLSPDVLLEWIYPRRVVFIFGAGHVGACVSHLASYVDFFVVAVDDRDEYANPQNLPNADQIIVKSFKEAFSGLSVDRDSHIVIVTRGHAHDKTTLAQALRTDASYIGMIGSRRKIKLIFDALIQDGFTEDDMARVHAPIGLAIGGETPQEIAVSIVAELIQERTKRLNVAG